MSYVLLAGGLAISSAEPQFGQVHATQALHVYLHRKPHYSDSFDMQLVYEDTPQESGSDQCRAAHINANGYANGNRYGDECGYGYRSQVCIDIGVKSVYIRTFGPPEIKSINKSF